jgi:hypothetical protein
MKQPKFSFELTPTNPDAELGFEVWINDQCVFNTEHVQEFCTVTGMLPDDNNDAEHTLKLVLKNKQTEHTQISETGEILNDSCLTISQLKFDDIELNFNLWKTAVYQHNVNGTSELTDHKFFGTMGCNGTVELKFSTPIYLWLLENM